MSERFLWPLTLRLTWGKTRSSRFSLFLAAAFPVSIAWLIKNEGVRAGVSAFLLLFPHIFLILAQDMVRSELAGGVLENVLFLDGAFRRYLWLKNPAVLAIGGAYAAGLFAGLAALAAATGDLRLSFLTRFLLGLLAGAYYVAAAGLASYYLNSGSNALVFILLQFAGFFGLLFSAGSRPGFVDYVIDGRLPSVGARFLFHGLLLVFPNIITLPGHGRFAWVPAAGLALGLYLQKLLVSRLELRK
jgi:hypothetical protein